MAAAMSGAWRDGRIGAKLTMKCRAACVRGAIGRHRQRYPRMKRGILLA